MGALQNVSRFFFLVTFMFGDAIFTLPSSTIRSGFAPYVTAMAINLTQQLASTWLLLECMQRYVIYSTKDAPHLNPRRQAGYHSLAMAYLPPCLVAFMHLQFFLGYLSPVVAQTITGTGSFAQWLGVSPASLVVPFYIPCAVAVLFFPQISQPILAALGVVRMTVLCTFVAGVGTILYSSSPPSIVPNTSWSNIVDIYGSITFVLGGMSSVFPAITTSAALACRDGKDARSLWWTSVAALIFICALTLSWGYIVLHVIPQTEAGALALGWPVDISIEWASNHGEMTTTPVLKAINAYYPGSARILSQLLLAYFLSLWSSWFGNYIAMAHCLNGGAAELLGTLAPMIGFPVSQEEIAELQPSDECPAPSDVFDKSCTISFTIDHAVRSFPWLASDRTACVSRRVTLLLLSRGVLHASIFILTVAFATTNNQTAVYGLYALCLIGCNAVVGPLTSAFYWGSLPKPLHSFCNSDSQPDTIHAIESTGLEATNTPYGPGVLSREAATSRLPLQAKSYIARFLAAFLFLGTSVALAIDAKWATMRILLEHESTALAASTFVFFFHVVLSPVCDYTTAPPGECHDVTSAKSWMKWLLDPRFRCMFVDLSIWGVYFCLAGWSAEVQSMAFAIAIAVNVMHALLLAVRHEKRKRDVARTPYNTKSCIGYLPTLYSIAAGADVAFFVTCLGVSVAKGSISASVICSFVVFGVFIHTLIAKCNIPTTRLDVAQVSAAQVPLNSDF